MNLATQKLQTEIKTLITSFEYMYNEAQDLENLYWKGSVQSDISGLAGSDPATQATQLTKDQLTSGLTFAEVVRKFFSNVALGSAADYLTTIEDLLYGTATATFRNNTVEAYGNRLVQFCRDCLTQYNRCRSIENYYNSTEIAAAVAAISTQTVLWGSTMNKDQLTSAITLCQNWQTLLANGTPGTADRKVTLGKWLPL